MTKKHFLKIAAAFREEIEFAKQFPNKNYNGAALDHLENLAGKLCDTFKEVNPHFDKDRFMAACGF